MKIVWGQRRAGTLENGRLWQFRGLAEISRPMDMPFRTGDDATAAGINRTVEPELR